METRLTSISSRSLSLTGTLRCGYVPLSKPLCSFSIVQFMNGKINLEPIINEYKRPWKLFSLFVGLSLLIVGSFYYKAPDWDIPISFIMDFLAYLTAPWSLRVVVERRWKLFPLMLFYTWFTVDGCYWIYWRFQDPVALALMREVNFPASLSLYGMCGLVWYHQGSLQELVLASKEFLSGTEGK